MVPTGNILTKQTGRIVYTLKRLAEITIEHRLLTDDMGRRTLCDDLAVMENDDGLRQCHDRAHDVLDEYNADAFTPGNLAQQPNQSIALARSQPAENLVKQEEFRPGWLGIDIELMNRGLSRLFCARTMLKGASAAAAAVAVSALVKFRRFMLRDLAGQ